MAMDPSKQSLIVAGLNVDVYSHPSATDPSVPVHVFFFLHGRGSSAQRDVVPFAKAFLNMTYAPNAPRTKDLIIVSFDHRNHGSRLVDEQRNHAWEEDPARTNDQHAIDMYTIQTGSAQDVSFLIDHLPSFLYPSGERIIVEWGMGGGSLGGHSTWIALSREPRLKIGIPIIGCPDYTKLMSQRAERLGIPFKPPYYPDSLKAYVDANDPAAHPYRANNASNPFLGRKILVLSGAKDMVVPWAACAEFVQNLEVGEEGIKRILLEKSGGHEWTPGMEREAGLFLSEWLNDWSHSNL